MRLLRVLVGFFFIAAGLAIGALTPQPVAIDLRRTLSAMKLAVDLERTGDLGKNIAKRGLVLAVSVVLPLRKRLRRQGP